MIDWKAPLVSSPVYSFWTTAEVAYLRESYGVIPVSHMDDLLERHSAKAIRNMASRMGLRSPLAPANIEAMRAARG